MDPSPHTTAPRRGDQNGVLGAAGVSHAVAAPGGTKATVDVAAAASTAASAAPTDAEITNTVLGVAPTAAFSDAGADDDGEAAYWEEYEYEHEGGESGVFYYNHATGTNQYEEPECLVGVPHQLYHAEDGPAWHAYVDEAGYVYYYNHTTQASQYEQPDGDYVPLRAQFQALAKTPELKGTHAQHHRDGHRSDVDLGPGATAEHQVTGEAGTHSRHTAETSHAKTGSGSVVVRPASPTPAAHEPSSAAPSTAPQPVQGPRGNRSFQQAAPGALPPPHVSSKAGRGAGAGVGVGVDAGIGAHVESGAEDDPTFASDDSDSDSSSLSSASSRDVPWVPGLGVAPAPSRVFRVFKWQNVCHAAVCESPALAVESVLRCVGMLLAVVAVVLLLVMRRVPCAVAWHLLQMRLREAVIAFFSFPSFLLCVILPLSVYVPGFCFL